MNELTEASYQINQQSVDLLSSIAGADTRL